MSHAKAGNRGILDTSTQLVSRKYTACVCSLAYCDDDTSLLRLKPAVSRWRECHLLFSRWIDDGLSAGVFRQRRRRVSFPSDILSQRRYFFPLHSPAVAVAFILIVLVRVCVHVRGSELYMCEFTRNSLEFARFPRFRDNLQSSRARSPWAILLKRSVLCLRL